MSSTARMADERPGARTAQFCFGIFDELPFRRWRFRNIRSGAGQLQPIKHVPHLLRHIADDLDDTLAEGNPADPLPSEWPNFYF